MVPNAKNAVGGIRQVVIRTTIITEPNKPFRPIPASPCRRRRLVLRRRGGRRGKRCGGGDWTALAPQGAAEY